jgi:tRNA-Thr(GGU) m(6)t(6)A37 methyltransferase TsaA
MEFTFAPIGIIHSCFKEKFGIPRQPGLVSESRAVLKIWPAFDRPEAFRGLDTFSHIWVVFVFHASIKHDWNATVRPPRMGGNRRTGVFATRSGFRPNPVGMSVVKLEKITRHEKQTCLHLRGIDVLDGTPVLDIKPYVPYADSIPEACGGFAAERPISGIEVCFDPEIRKFCLEKERDGYPGFLALIEQVLKADPRPAYHATTCQKKQFGIRLYDFDIQWEISDNTIRVYRITHE